MIPPLDSLERRVKIAAMRAGGMSLRAVADIFGVHPEWVRQIELRGSPKPEQDAALARFPDLRPALALRLAARYPDAAAVRAANDEEVRSLRGLGEVQFARLRARCPYSPVPVRREEAVPFADELPNPLRSSARAFAPSRPVPR